MSCIDESTTPMDPCKYRVITPVTQIYFRPFIGAPHVDPSTSLGPIFAQVRSRASERWSMAHVGLSVSWCAWTSYNLDAWARSGKMGSGPNKMTFWVDVNLKSWKKVSWSWWKLEDRMQLFGVFLRKWLGFLIGSCCSCPCKSVAMMLLCFSFWRCESNLVFARSKHGVFSSTVDHSLPMNNPKNCVVQPGSQVTGGLAIQKNATKTRVKLFFFWRVPGDA